ncbi:MAG TPA: hypothetical protein DD412_01695 [Holosporales bacterium]|nr:hypothetical protein [Holosporales bacterium]
MKQIKHPNTTLFRAGLMAVFLLFASTAVQGSLLEEEDTEVRVQKVIDDIPEKVVIDLTDFGELGKNDLGSTDSVSFELMKGIFSENATRFSLMNECLTLLYKENPSNKESVSYQRSFDVSEYKEDFVDFHRGLPFSTLLFKLRPLAERMDKLGLQLARAFEEHKRLKVISLKNAYSALAVQVLKTTDAFTGINALYDKPAALEPEDVSHADLDTLKQKVSDFEEAVLAYDVELREAKKWQQTFTAYHKKYVSLTAKQEKLASAFSVLEKANADNPHLKIVGDLDDIAGEGNLVTLKGTLDDIVEAQRTLSEALAKGQLWQKAFVVHEKQYVLLTAEQEKLGTAFQLLREANDENPNLKAVGDLDEISGEGDLATIKETLEGIVEDQRVLSEALVLAKAWKPEVEEDL